MMYSFSLFGDGGVKAPAAPKSRQPAQGLFGATSDTAAAKLPRPEQFARL